MSPGVFRDDNGSIADSRTETAFVLQKPIIPTPDHFESTPNCQSLIRVILRGCRP